MKSITASLVDGSLYCPLGLFLSLHTLASIMFGAIPGRLENIIGYFFPQTAGKACTIIPKICILDLSGLH